MKKFLILSSLPFILFFIGKTFWEKEASAFQAEKTITSEGSVPSEYRLEHRISNNISNKQNSACQLLNNDALIDSDPQLASNVSAIISKVNASGTFDSLSRSAEPNEILAYFSIASWCSPIRRVSDLTFLDTTALIEFNRNNCNAISRAHRLSPITILDANTNAFTPDMMLIYAKNAIIQSKIIQFLDESPSESKYYLDVAQRIGDDAAKKGFKPAISFMAEQYDTGIFSAPNLENAYLYLTALQNSSTTSDSHAALNYIYAKMNKSQYQKAEKLISECQTAKRPPKNLINPFTGSF